MFENVDKAIASAPVCTHHIQNWHTERRTSGSGKNRKTRTVRVNTHYHSENFHIPAYVDKSPPSSALHYIDIFFLTRINTEKIVNLSVQAEERYEAQKANVLALHIRDKRHDYWFSKQTDEYLDEETLALNSNKGSSPWFVNRVLLFALDVIMMGWIQRL